ncbi:DNA recombination protein RmuC [Alteromonas marina]|uniref:DNA recombination protein RmuC n=1 Tax=unclassified Alteromonas TaxID=2614992 RepID=UPI0012E6D8A2|nr:DNA recombination protein RmuC [Alteromonas sp. KUL150]GFD70727.1 DNA recombination protein RmuC [Tenacibaculum sp. KUL113]GFD85897.1 DNA recombination protein RmuC [Alteromonas sp. KUL150]
MLINLISNEPLAFLIAFISICAFALYLFVRSRANSSQLTQKALDYEQLLDELNNERVTNAKLQAQSDAHQARIQALHAAHEDKLAAMNASEQRLQIQFENLANRIFEEKQQRYTQQTKHNIEAVLAPFKNELDGFKRQISEQHIREGQERASLKTEILGLKALNQKITEEAAALTSALKGDNKKQGNWGEVVLERILKESGLREGHEFETQMSATSEQGKRYQPDVVVHLPNDKDVIIDSKVSLAAYERYYNCDDESEKAQFLSQHVASIKGHIKGLGAKDYQTLRGLKTLDYVLLFIPIEPAFLIAVEEEPELVTMALNHNIMLVSPTNLLVALRTINNIWQYEYQNQNAQLIAEQAAKLYDKFVGFVSDMEKVGKSMDSAHASYEQAMNKLTSGRGNMVRQIEKFRELGVQPSKQMSQHVKQLSQDE